MQFDLALFLRALGLAFVLEGLCWALFPGGMRRAMASLLPRPESQLRLAGLAAVRAALGEMPRIDVIADAPLVEGADAPALERRVRELRGDAA